MHVLSILSHLRTELYLAEQSTIQAWEDYATHLSASTLAAAVEATQSAIALHRQVADRLEQLAGTAAAARVPTALLAPQTPSAA